jgi:nucleotide-binding universal stress UspA family protein
MAQYPATILLASDGSSDAQLSERIAADLCARSGATLHIVHAWQNYPVGAYPYPALTSAETIRMFEAAAEQVLAESVGRVEAVGGKVTGQQLRHGAPAHEIVNMADELAVDLLIIGSRGHGPLHRLVLGSVSEAVVHGVHRPTLVVRGGETAWPPAQIVIGDDGSADASRVATLGAALGHLYGAKVILARVMPELPMFRWYEEGQRAATEKIYEDMLARARDDVTGDARRLSVAGMAAPEPVVVAGDPATVVLDIAESESAPTLIAVGCRGLGPLGRLRLGSVSTKLLHAARGPLLIAPHEAPEN